VSSFASFSSGVNSFADLAPFASKTSLFYSQKDCVKKVLEYATVVAA
jgi:hypothetical protein